MFYIPNWTALPIFLGLLYAASPHPSLLHSLLSPLGLQTVNVRPDPIFAVLALATACFADEVRIRGLKEVLEKLREFAYGPSQPQPNPK